jgi:hypothetical protein
MKRLPLLLLASLLVITVSCSQSNKGGLQLKKNVKQILFFSNESNYSEEGSYYDALIELKKRFPDEIKNLIVLSPNNAKQLLKSYKIETCPALLVVYNENVIVKITGKVSKEDIINPVSKALSDDPKK